MLWQLRAAGMFEGLAGILLGEFPNCRHDFGAQIEEVFRASLSDLGIPVYWDLPFGHVPRSLSLPLGWKATLVDRQLSIEAP